MSSRELDDDQMTLLMLGMFGLPVVVPAGLAWLAAQSQWAAQQLVRYYVLAPASADPLFPIPGLEGAGLDLARIVILCSVILISLIWAIYFLKRATEGRAR